jgi:hypothetical protein
MNNKAQFVFNMWFFLLTSIGLRGFYYKKTNDGEGV